MLENTYKLRVTPSHTCTVLPIDNGWMPAVDGPSASGRWLRERTDGYALHHNQGAGTMVGFKADAVHYLQQAGNKEPPEQR